MNSKNSNKNSQKSVKKTYTPKIKKPSTGSTISDSELHEAIQQLRQKVLSSAVLNGGFDRMSFIIEKIQENQADMTLKVNSIHEAIFHPDEGLFSRVKDVEHVKEQINAFENLEREMLLIQQQQQSANQQNDRDLIVKNENQTLIDDHETNINELLEYKNKMNSIAKWAIVTVSSVATTLIGKLLYDFLTGHITIN